MRLCEVESAARAGADATVVPSRNRPHGAQSHRTHPFREKMDGKACDERPADSRQTGTIPPLLYLASRLLGSLAFF